MSTYTDALHDFVQASINYRQAVTAGSLDEVLVERALAQAGDVLEREMEAVMRKIAVSER